MITVKIMTLIKLINSNSYNSYTYIIIFKKISISYNSVLKKVGSRVECYKITFFRNKFFLK